ncbi:transcriptional regulator [Enterovibrio norvegicus]|uniref:helix-turn-helix domain-containing protein n=1 Tax=Enterovibrio norvegicus TaxID=188144 RepID=UPI000319E77B|nr:helix-turn-helix transcriptional regulator [Enterovibrio norvegicus]OEF51002.1 transcriptional regulator [Enterovibrio norvegicus]
MLREPIIEVIKNRRKAAGMTQAALASKAGMTLKTYQRIEQGADMRISYYRAVITALELADLDISLDMLDVDTATAHDVAAAARVLSEESRRLLIKIIISEWQRQQVNI